MIETTPVVAEDAERTFQFAREALWRDGQHLTGKGEQGIGLLVLLQLVDCQHRIHTLLCRQQIPMPEQADTFGHLQHDSQVFRR